MSSCLEPAGVQPARGSSSLHAERSPARAGARAGCRAEGGLEDEAQGQLDVAPVPALRGRAAEVGVGDVAVRPAQVRVVREVEELRPELDPLHPAQREVLEEGDVPLLIARVAEDVARRVAEVAERRGREVCHGAHIRVAFTAGHLVVFADERKFQLIVIKRGVSIDAVVTGQTILAEVGWNLMDLLSLESLLITRGEKGMALFEKDRNLTLIPARTKTVYDVTGAGDTVIATLTVARTVGATMQEAAILANAAAGLAVAQFGTARISSDELKAGMLDHL